MASRYQLARRHKFIERRSGDLTLNSNLAWANVDTGLDLVLPAVVDDVIEVGINGLIGNESPVLFLDVATIVGGSPVDSFGNRGAALSAPPSYGIAGWRGGASAYTIVGAPYRYRIVASDLSNATVTLRLRYCTDTAANKALYAGANYPFSWYAWNVGPQKPH
jgi:hypothetical protein